MNSKVYLLDELSKKVGVSQSTIIEWEKQKLIKAAGLTEDKVMYFTPVVIKDCENIVKLTELGYNLDDIGRIIKKVGLPSSASEKSEIKIKEKLLTVGELAKKINVSPRTLKHWEDKGIIDADMRSEGGFRLYSEVYVYLCSLILDLQNFGYTLDKIKILSDYFREFIAFQSDINLFSQKEVDSNLEVMTIEVQTLFEKIEQLKKGIERWEELLKTKKKELSSLKTKNRKRGNEL